MRRLWHQLSEVVAERIRDRVECDLDLRRLAEDIVEELDIDDILNEVHSQIVERAKNGIVDTSTIVEEIVDSVLG